MTCISSSSHSRRAIFSYPSFYSHQAAYSFLFYDDDCNSEVELSVMETKSKIMSFMRVILLFLSFFTRGDGFLVPRQLCNNKRLIRCSTKNNDVNETKNVDKKNVSIMDRMLKFRSDFSSAASEGFGTKARNVANTMTVGDVVVPLCGNLTQRQILANKGIYAGVEYQVCSLQLNDEEITTITDIATTDRQNVVAYMKPNYKLRDYLERTDWPVSVEPFKDVPLWLSKSVYEAGTMVGTLSLAFTYLSIAAILAFFVRITFVPSESMMPTLNPGDVTVVTRSIPIGPLKPRAGDVILFDPPSELNDIISSLDQQNASPYKPQSGEQFLKRVVAAPGELVGVKNAEPYVIVKEKQSDDTTRKFRVDIIGPYSRPDIFPASSWDRPASMLGRNEYFVVGDNGFRSVDSRVWGPLKERYIFGKAQWIIWPMSDFGPIKPGQISTIEK